MQWPILVGIILVGIYFSVLPLPPTGLLDSSVVRGLHIAFLVLAGWTGVMVFGQHSSLVLTGGGFLKTFSTYSFTSVAIDYSLTQVRLLGKI